MSFIKVGNAYLNPLDVSRVELFPLTLTINITMRDGEKFQLFIAEERLVAMMDHADKKFRWSIAPSHLRERMPNPDDLPPLSREEAFEKLAWACVLRHTEQRR